MNEKRREGKKGGFGCGAPDCCGWSFDVDCLFPLRQKGGDGQYSAGICSEGGGQSSDRHCRREADETLPDYEEGTAWYEPYIEYLVSRGYWESGGEDSAGEVSYETAAQRDLTWRQVRLLVEGLNADGG